MHADEDAAAPFSQSEKMQKALAGTPTRLVKLTADDHALSSSQSRITVLRELEGFLKQHLGPTAAR